MTVPSNVNYNVSLYTTGGSLVIPYTFRVLKAEDISVELAADDGEGASTELVYGTDYTVSGVGSYTGGYVTLLSAPANNTQVTIYRYVQNFVQTTDLRNQGAFLAEVHEDVFDLLTMMLQTLLFETERSLTVRASDIDTVSTALGAPEPRKLLGWSADGTAIVGYDVSDWVAIPAFLAWAVDSYLSDGVATTRTLATNPVSIGNLDVTVGGLTQTAGVHFTLSGTTLTWVVVPPAGQRVTIRYGQSLPASSWPTHASSHAFGGSDPITPAAIKAAPVSVPVSTKTGTANYTLQLSDSHSVILLNTTASMSVVVPTNAAVAFEIGTQINVTRLGGTDVSVSPASGVTIRSSGSRYALSQQYATATLIKIDTDTWLLAGDLI
jgi:hypothetical protein